MFMLLFSTNLISQTDNCSTTNLTINASCTTSTYSIPNAFDDSGISLSCGSVKKDGWFSFTTGVTTTQMSF